MADEDNDDAATASAGRAAREAAARPPPAASPLPPSGYAVAGPGRREAERSPGVRGPEPQERRAMSDDAELALLRAVSCSVVLERMAGWKLDARQSTRRALKYRRGEGEVLIVNHDGRGWWDPLSQAKGDVFSLVQHLEPGLNFGHVRQVLRRLVGIAPTYPALVGKPQGRGGESLDERWATRPRLRQGSPAWFYLADQRCLPAEVLTAAAGRDAVREGYCGSAWFAHRDGRTLSHIEVRGPAFKTSLRGCRKTLFRFGGAGTRLAIAEAPIDALSLAAIEHCRSDTLYVATGGGMGPGTIEALHQLLRRLAALPNAEIASAADANAAGDRYAERHAAGDRYAERHAALAAEHGLHVQRLRPSDGLDWNDVLQQRSRA